MMKALTTGNQLARELATQCGIPVTATAESLYLQPALVHSFFSQHRGVPLHSITPGSNLNALVLQPTAGLVKQISA